MIWSSKLPEMCPIPRCGNVIVKKFLFDDPETENDYISLKLQLAHDSGILVNERLETGIKDVFAAGDICTASWAENSPHWTQVIIIY